jgi:hypothetical protein
MDRDIYNVMLTAAIFVPLILFWLLAFKWMDRIERIQRVAKKLRERETNRGH